MFFFSFSSSPSLVSLNFISIESDSCLNEFRRCDLHHYVNDKLLLPNGLYTYWLSFNWHCNCLTWNIFHVTLPTLLLLWSVTVTVAVDIAAVESKEFLNVFLSNWSSNKWSTSKILLKIYLICWFVKLFDATVIDRIEQKKQKFTREWEWDRKRKQNKKTHNGFK